jgi:alkylated DNA repair dioxygenase AlkB
MKLENIVGEELAMPYYQNFITKDKEVEIFMFLSKYMIDNCGMFRNETKNRNNIFRFGSKFPYPTNHTELPIPDIFNNILPPGTEFSSVTINEYYPGQIIDYHVDAPPMEKIYILSLCSPATLKFRNKKNKDEIIEFDLEQFSLMVLEGKLRWNYEHSLEANEYRISVVFR